MEYTSPQRGRQDPYCWVCLGYGCDNPQEALGDAAVWSPERATAWGRVDQDRWSWLSGSSTPPWQDRVGARAA